MLDTSATRDVADRILNETLPALLVSGGDGRMRISPNTGLNKYGCAPRIRDAVPFGSCTASSPIELGLEGAREVRATLRVAARDGAEGVALEVDRVFEQLRGRLLRQLEIDPASVQVAFCPSGTDAEYLALALVRQGSDQPVVNIVSGPSEVGGGTTHAAAGRHFDPFTPDGAEQVPGTPLDEEFAEAVRVRTIDLRDDEGLMRDDALLDEIATRMVEQAVEAGSRVMLHVVAHSKTGVHAPSLECVEALRNRYGARLTVLVDAAQGRLSRRGLQEALDAGYLVLFTGSKFYGGPPFSGALFVPEELWPARTGLDELPEGLRHYLTAPELPRSWTGPRSGHTTRPNLGLLLRWGAAMAQIEAYYATDMQRRLQILRMWETKVPELLGASPVVRLFPVNPVYDPDTRRLLESKTTVFPFFLRREGAAQPLNKAVLTRVFHWLNRDISGLLPDLDDGSKAVLAREMHLGQPVLLSGSAERERSVLRVALGGPLITRVADDPLLGPTFEARVFWLQAQVQILRRKLEIIVDNLDELTERDPT